MIGHVRLHHFHSLSIATNESNTHASWHAIATYATIFSPIDSKIACSPWSRKITAIIPT